MMYVVYTRIRQLHLPASDGSSERYVLTVCRGSRPSAPQIKHDEWTAKRIFIQLPRDL